MGITPANSSANGTVSADRRCFRNLQDDLGFWWKDDGCRSSPLNDNRLCVYEFVASFVSTKETVHQASFIRFVISRFRTLGKHPRLGVLELFNDGTNVNAKAETAPRNAMSKELFRSQIINLQCEFVTNLLVVACGSSTFIKGSMTHTSLISKM